MFKFIIYAIITIAILAGFGLIRGLPENNQLSYLVQEAAHWIENTQQDISREAEDLKRDAGF